jgi:hypothetical protein
LIFNRQKKKEEKEEKKRLEEQKKLEEQQKKDQEQQQKEQKEKEKQNKNLDIAKLGPVPIAEDEQSLYRYNVEQGIFRKKTIASYFVTNDRIMTVIGVDDNPQIALENISDVVAINTHREYEGGYRGISTSYRGIQYSTGGQRGKSVSYILFIFTSLSFEILFH